MLNFLYDFVPVLLFFLMFKLYGIYVATWVGMIATGVQVVTTLMWKKKLDKQQLITFIVFVMFGSMTLYFHNPIFVKWKPTIVFWIFGLFLIGSHFIGKKVLIQRMLEPLIEKQQALPPIIWTRLNVAWIFFFMLLGSINLLIAYHLSTNAWVNFKFYGILGSLLFFSFLQAICIARYISE